MYKNRLNGKCYVGQTIQSVKRRQIQHTSAAKRGVTQPFYQAIRKYGVGNFTFEIIIDNVPSNLLDDLEINIIHMYDAYTKGYNASTGGNVNRGFTLTDETKEKLRRINTGKKASQATIAKMRVAQTGRVHSENTRKKISESNVGNYHSEVTKQKMRERVIPEIQKQAMKDAWKRDTEGNRKRLDILKTVNVGRIQSKEELTKRSTTRPRGEKNHKSKMIRCLETDEVFATVSEAAKKIDTCTSNVSAVCKGRYKKTKGFSFEYFTSAAIENVYVEIG